MMYEILDIFLGCAEGAFLEVGSFVGQFCRLTGKYHISGWRCLIPTPGY